MASLFLLGMLSGCVAMAAILIGTEKCFERRSQLKDPVGAWAGDDDGSDAMAPDLEGVMS